MAFNLFCNPVGKLLAHFQAYLSTSVSSLLSKSKEEIFAEKPSFAIDAQNYDTVTYDGFISCCFGCRQIGSDLSHTQLLLFWKTYGGVRANFTAPIPSSLL